MTRQCSCVHRWSVAITLMEGSCWWSRGVVFLRNWRASLIPLMAVPVSIIGTLRSCSDGLPPSIPVVVRLVLSIGIVVDDAIVVVETSSGISRTARGRPAARRAMAESRADHAITSVLAAVFIHTAFLSGLQGRFYRSSR